MGRMVKPLSPLGKRALRSGARACYRKAKESPSIPVRGFLWLGAKQRVAPLALRYSDDRLRLYLIDIDTTRTVCDCMYGKVRRTSTASGSERDSK